MKVASQAQIKIDDMATLFLDTVARVRNQGYLESDKTIPKPKEKADPYSLEYYEQQAEHAQMLRELHKKGR